MNVIIKDRETLYIIYKGYMSCDDIKAIQSKTNDFIIKKVS